MNNSNSYIFFRFFFAGIILKVLSPEKSRLQNYLQQACVNNNQLTRLYVSSTKGTGIMSLGILFL